MDAIEGSDNKHFNETGPSNRYSNEGAKKNAEELANLKDQLQVNNEKVDRLQKLTYDLQAEKRELLEKVEKLEAGKSRMEKILK